MVKKRVTQGSVIGHPVVLLSVNDLPSVINVPTWLYADVVPRYKSKLLQSPSTISTIGQLVGTSPSIPLSATTSLLNGLLHLNYPLSLGIRANLNWPQTLLKACVFSWAVPLHPPPIARLPPKQGGYFLRRSFDKLWVSALQ